MLQTWWIMGGEGRAMEWVMRGRLVCNCLLLFFFIYCFQMVKKSEMELIFCLYYFVSFSRKQLLAQEMLWWVFQPQESSGRQACNAYLHHTSLVVSPGWKTNPGRAAAARPCARTPPQGWGSLQLRECIFYSQSISPANSGFPRAWQPPNTYPICPDCLSKTALPWSLPGQDFAWKCRRSSFDFESSAPCSLNVLFSDEPGVGIPRGDGLLIYKVREMLPTIQMMERLKWSDEVWRWCYLAYWAIGYKKPTASVTWMQPSSSIPCCSHSTDSATLSKGPQHLWAVGTGSPHRDH